MWLSIVILSFLLNTCLVLVVGIRIPLRRVKRDADEEEVDDDSKFAVVELDQVSSNFYGDITVGTAWEGGDDQVLTVNFDTGSRDLWLTDIGVCVNNKCPPKDVQPFDSSKSSTFEKLGQPFTYGYVDGTSVEGYIVKDTLAIGTGENKILVKNQVFGLADNITGLFEESDGIFGLGLRSVSRLPGCPDPPFLTMIQQVKILPVFGIYLNKHKDGTEAGELIFGGHDDQLFDGEFSSHQVETVSDEYRGWMIKFDKITVSISSTTNMAFNHLGNILAVPDSGCTVIGGPDKVFNALNNIIFKNAPFPFNNGSFTFYCTNKISELPDVTFIIGGVPFLLTAQDYIKIFTTDEKVCRTAFRSMNTDHIILGHQFMEKYYTRFDMLNLRVQFAKAKHGKKKKQEPVKEAPKRRIVPAPVTRQHETPKLDDEVPGTPNSRVHMFEPSVRPGWRLVPID